MGSVQPSACRKWLDPSVLGRVSYLRRADRAVIPTASSNHAHSAPSEPSRVAWQEQMGHFRSSLLSSSLDSTVGPLETALLASALDDWPWLAGPDVTNTLLDLLLLLEASWLLLGRTIHEELETTLLDEEDCRLLEMISPPEEDEEPPLLLTTTAASTVLSPASTVPPSRFALTHLEPPPSFISQVAPNSLHGMRGQPENGFCGQGMAYPWLHQ